MNEYVKNLNRIEFIVTMACTGKCKHCSEGDHTNCAGHIDAKRGADAIRQVCQHYSITSFMTFGGEALLYPDVVCTLHQAAAEMGIPKRDLITNGFFSKDPNRIHEVAFQLKESGVTQILLSADAFHQETIPLETVKYFASCICEAQIPIKLSPAWLVSREDSNPYNCKTREILSHFEDLQIPIGDGNIIFPSGNALNYLSEYFDPATEISNPYEDDPYDIRSIGFSPEGDVLNGNIHQTPILDLLEQYHP